MVNAGGLPRILDKIKTAGTPPKFTVEFLRTTLGFKSSNDRAVIGVLKALGFLSDDGTPTLRYNEHKDSRRSGAVLAQGLREGWAPIFMSDETAHLLDRAELKGVFQRVTGKSENVADLMAHTFRQLADRADWAIQAEAGGMTLPEEAVEEIPAEEPVLDQGKPGASISKAPSEQALRTDSWLVTLHNDIHVHLPPSVDQAVYTAIFRALREELLDD
jgi:hypothetical protein